MPGTRGRTRRLRWWWHWGSWATLGYHLLDPIAALVVGLMVTRMGWQFSRNALRDLMDRAIDAETVMAIRETMLETPGVLGAHDVRTRKMRDMVLVDVHLDINAAASVKEGHEIALEARRRKDVLNVMTHVDPVDVA